MKILACRDMGVDCPFVAKGKTEEEVMKNSMEHAMNIHSDKVKQMMTTMTEDQMKAAMKSKIKEE